MSETFSSWGLCRCIFLFQIIEGSLEVKLPRIWTDEKAEVGRIREEKRREAKKKEYQRRERVRKKKMQVREKVEKSRITTPAKDFETATKTFKFCSRHSGVQLFISHLAGWLRTRCFSEPTFRPSGATKQWKNTASLFRATCSRQRCTQLSIFEGSLAELLRF